MLACVCQPAETALLFKGGPPVAMGPLGTNKLRQNTSEAMKSLKLISTSVRRISDETKDSSPSHNSSPILINSSGSLLNLRKIERKAKSTKILVNPVCSDSIGTSDDSNRSENVVSKWNGKKKRLKAESGSKRHKKGEHKPDKNEPISRGDGKEDKKLISCFKLKSSESKSRSEDDQNLGKENCKNENASNLMNTEKPDVINHSRKNSNEIFIDEGTMTDQMLPRTDQLDTGKTDSTIACKDVKVSVCTKYK